MLTYLAHGGHEALVVTPGQGPSMYAGVPARRCGGLPGHPYPDLILAGPALLGAPAALVGWALGLPPAAYFQTDRAAYAEHHGLTWLTASAWRYLRAVHALADRTYCPTPTVQRYLAAQGFCALALCPRGGVAEQFHPRYRDAAWRAGPGPHRRPGDADRAVRRPALAREEPEGAGHRGAGAPRPAARHRR
ncbi:MAG TPA: hypothetical protein VFU78_22115 [Thermomicrobiales bacterium]|nr:hypothetical protein [Thermomicrobiales bacterium]